MKQLQFRRHILPHLVAVLVFLIVTILFFNPIFFKNRSLDQYDIKQWKGSAQQAIEHREETGDELLWTTSMFSGMPSYLVELDWSDDIITATKIIFAAGLPHPVRNIFAAFLSYYILLLAFRVRPWLAIGGALAFGLSSYMLIGLGAGHNARIGAIAYMPLVMAGIHTCLYRNRWAGFGLTTLAVALHLRENHLQITYYLLFIIAFYGLIQLIDAFRKGTIKSFAVNAALLLVAALVGLGTFYGKFWAISEYSEYSMRGVSELRSDQEAGENESGLKRDYAFEYSAGIYEPLTLMIPQFYGGASSNLLAAEEDSEVLRALQSANNPQLANQLARYTSAYWGPQSASAPYYAGAVICFLFVLGFFFAPRKLIVWSAVLFALGIILSWGDSWEAFNYAMFDYFPGYNKFRSVTFAIVMSLFMMPLLGFIGLENFLQQPKDSKTMKKAMIATGITAGLCLLVLLFSGMADFMREGEEQLPDWFLNALTADREDLRRADAFRSLIFILLAAATVYFHYRQKISFSLFAGILGVLILVDLWGVDARYFTEDNYRRSSDRGFFVATPADQEILKDTSPGYRVYELRNPFNEARTSYYHASLGGYHGAKIRRYQDLIEYCISPETQELINAFQSGSPDLNDFGVLNMLNTRYLVYGSEAANIIRNPAALGNAWFVREVIPVNAPDEEIAETCAADTRNTAVVDVSRFEMEQTQFSAEGSIQVTEYAPDDLTFTSENSGEGLAVFSEIYYPEGWQVTIDGEPAELIRANYVLRALRIPAGSHTIRMEFRPAAYYVGDTIILISSVLALIIFIGGMVLGWREADLSGTQNDPVPSAA